jgi:MFS family permease
MATELRPPAPAGASHETGAPPAGLLHEDTAEDSRGIYFGYYIVGAALFAQFIAVGSQASVSGVFLTEMTEALDWTRAEFTYAQTINRFLMAFAGVWIGVNVDRFGGRPIMLAGAFVLSGSLIAVSQVTELWQWLVLRGLIFAIGAAMVGNLVVNVTLSKWFVERRGRAIAVSAMGVSLAGVVWPPLITWVIAQSDWRGGWIALGIIALAVLVPASLFMRRSPEDYGLHPDGRTAAQLRGGAGAAAALDFRNSFTRSEALRTSAFYLVVFAFGLGGVGIGVILLHTIPYLTGEGFSPATAAAMSSVMSFPAFVAKPFWGWLTDKTEPKYLSAVAFWMAGAGMAIILAGAKAGSLPVLAGGYILLGWGFGGFIPLQETIWGSYFGRRYLGAVRSVALPFALLLAAGGPLAASFYADIVGNYDGVFLTVTALWVIGGLVMLTIRRPTKPTLIDVLTRRPRT